MTTTPDSTHPSASAFPAGVSGPALRALAHAGIRSAAQLAQWTKADIAALHGMGPKGIRLLEQGLAMEGRHFRRGSD